MKSIRGVAKLHALMGRAYRNIYSVKMTEIRTLNTVVVLLFNTAIVVMPFNYDSMMKNHSVLQSINS